MTLPVELTTLFDAALAKSASDMHLLSGASPRVRVYGDLLDLPEHPPLTAEGIENLLLPLFSPSTRSGFQEGTVTSSETLITYGNFNFVVYMFRSGGAFSATVRILSAYVPTLDQVGFDCVDIFKSLAKTSSGLILITGPVGCGKQTTAFALIQEFNANLPRRIHLLEESLSLRLQSDKGLVSSLLIGQDVADYDSGIRMLMRGADPDVIYLTDLPDTQTVQSALMAARTGHLVIANATAPSAAQALSTICQALLRDAPDSATTNLAEHLVAVTNQRLFKKANASGRIPAYEIIQNTQELRESIRNGVDLEIVLQELTMGTTGIRTLPEVISKLTQEGKITESAGKEALRDYPML